jgi:hypothetical protein
MKLIRLKIKDVEKEFLTEMENLTDIVSDNIDINDLSEFFGNTEEYISKYVTYEILEENNTPKLFLVKNLNPIQADSYDSAVFCSISEFTVRKLALELSETDFSNIEIIFLGVANKNIKPGEICSSYNSGSY